ncbi:hypothetical protein ACWFNS_15150 [Oerskovia enterophila]
MTFYGADVAALRDLATTFDAGAEELDGSRTGIRGKLGSVPWHGPGAERYRADWQHQLEPALTRTSASLREAARRLRANAADQERTSSADGGGTSSGSPRPGPSTTPPTGPAQGPAQGAAPGLPGFSFSLEGENAQDDAVRNPDGSIRTPATITNTTSGSFDASYDPETGTTTVGAGGGLSSALAVKGATLEFGASGAAEITRTTHSEDGFTTYAGSQKGSLTVSGGAEIKEVGASVAYGNGYEMAFETTVPDAVAGDPTFDPRGISPTDPRSIPVGGSVTLDSKNFKSSDFAGSFEIFAYEESIGTSEGMSKAVERLDENHVRVTTGPTSSLDRSGAVGLDLDVIKAMVGTTGSHETGAMQTAVLDVSTPEGSAAYARYLAGGELPSQDGPGVSESALVSRWSGTSGSSADLTLFGHEMSKEHVASVGDSVAVTRPDGSVSWSGQVAFDDDSRRMEYERAMDANGVEDPSASRLTVSIDLDKNTAGIINNGYLDAAGGRAEAGQTLQITLDGHDERALADQAFGKLMTGFNGATEVVDMNDPLASIVMDGEFGQDPTRRPYDSVVGGLLGQTTDNSVVLDHLARISDDGKLPGTVRVVG